MHAARVGFLTLTLASVLVIAPPVFAALPACPSEGGSLTITVDNQTGSPQAVTLAGMLVTPSCAGGTIGFEQTVACGTGTTACLALTGLASGIWTYHIATGAQSQYQRGIVVAADPSGTPNVISWVAFKTVLSVDRVDDVSANPVPQCPSLPGAHTCTLRQAMSAGATAPAPLLVQFDPVVFPAGRLTTIQLTQSDAMPIDGPGMVVDGTDPDGKPSVRGDRPSRVVRLPASDGNFVFTNTGSALVGLSLQRPTLSLGAQPGNIVVFDGTSGRAQHDLILNCKIDGGGSALTTKLVGQDCIQGWRGAGADWSAANVVQNTEVTACPDKGVKATTLAFVKVVESWLHHNIGGGIQATLSGNIEADRNLVEYSGYIGRSQVYVDANGLAANGADAIATPAVPSVLRTDGNVVRNSSSRGISVQGLSSAVVTNDLSCGAVNGGTAGQNGIAIFNSSADAAVATVRGVAAVYNGRNGATLADQSTGDFGQAGSGGGNNAFTQNATNGGLGGHNFDNSSTQIDVPALGNQWQHCYADATHPAATCDGNVALDINGSVSVAAPQSYRADAGTLPIRIAGLYPTKAAAGEMVRIVGSGFNAIDAYPARGNCTASIQRGNRCGRQIVGNCVEYQSAQGLWRPLRVESVTPTEIVVKLPRRFRCAQPTAIRVRRLDHTGTPVAATGIFCTNS